MLSISRSSHWSHSGVRLGPGARDRGPSGCREAVPPAIARLRSVVLDEDVVEPLHLARLSQLEAGVLAHRLVQAIAGDAERVLPHDQRLVDQRGQQVQRRGAGPPSLAKTDSTSSTVNRPAKTHRRRRSLCSGAVSRSWLQSMVVRSVCCRGSAARPPPVRRANRSVSRSRICSTESTRIRTAASSIASGRPSSRRHRPTTADRFDALSSNDPDAAAARSENNMTASFWRSREIGCSSPAAGSSSGGTGTTRSPGPAGARGSSRSRGRRAPHEGCPPPGRQTRRAHARNCRRGAAASRSRR